MNSTKTTTPSNQTKTTTGIHSVRFDLSQSGDLSLSSSTPLANILKLGAMAYTTKHNDVTGRMETATDELGLNLMKEQLTTGVGLILDGIGVVADLMSTNCDSVSGREVSTLGWLICGLAEMASDMEYHRNQAEFELRKTNR